MKLPQLPLLSALSWLSITTIVVFGVPDLGTRLLAGVPITVGFVVSVLLMWAPPVEPRG